jgi:hypothetical protein
MKVPKLIASTLQFPDIPAQKASVRLFIVRRVALNPHVGASVPGDVGTRKRAEPRGLLWKTTHCGEARFGRRTLGESSISWRGEIALAEELATPGFVASRLSVEVGVCLLYIRGGEVVVLTREQFRRTGLFDTIHYST